MTSERDTSTHVHGTVRPGMRPNPVGGLDIRPEPWMAKGLCGQTDPEAFYVEKGGTTKPAKAICMSCEVREPCLQYALDRDERFGVWGGYSERERRRLNRGEVVALSMPKWKPPHGLKNMPKPSTDRLCAHCGEGFLGKTTAKYCSPVCKRAVEAVRYNKARRKDAA